MSREYFIQDASGQRRLSELELPIRVGGSKLGGIQIPGVAADKPLAIIALADGHAYIQPGDVSIGIFHNDERLTDSAWLKSGDRVQIGDSILSWDVQGDRVLINIRAHKLDISKPRPPKQARRSEPPQDHLPVADNLPQPGSRKGLKRSLIVLITLLVLFAAYLLSATSVSLKLVPADAQSEFKGFPPPVSFGGSRLMLPGKYQLAIHAEGYQALETDVDIKMGAPQALKYELIELPGLLRLQVDPMVDVQLLNADVEQIVNADGLYELPRGLQSLKIKTTRYLPQGFELEVAGFGVEQTQEIKLQPAWANVAFSSLPTAADVLVDDEVVGQTPLSVEILRGQHKLEIAKAGFKRVIEFRTVEAGVDFVVDEVQLVPVDGRLLLSSKPSGASILIGDKFLGTTPQTLSLAAETEHRLRLSKTGYASVEKVFTLTADEERSLELSLGAEYATVFVNIHPAGSELSVNGKKTPIGSGRLRLQTRKNTLKVSKPGYISKTVSLTPRAGVSQTVEIKLLSKKQQQAQAKAAATPQQKITKVGHKLELIEPDSNIKMGASRRDAGRRSNESQRLVKLQRPFYLGQYEITNADYRKFKPAHNSGSADSAMLNDDNQPVVNISWDDAARYCNWLSKKEGLPLAYSESGGKMQALLPLNSGYRLPTEAEWAWVARRQGQPTEQRYPWRGLFPPTTKTGNYADAQIADTLADIVPSYDDGYRGTAPVGSFPPWPQTKSGGFFDLGGNVAEWMHDYYAVYPGEASRLVVDPAGPATGSHHVVRGSSWRQGSISELRLSYRDYSAKQRPDLGFRIARYTE